MLNVWAVGVWVLVQVLVLAGQAAFGGAMAIQITIPNINNNHNVVKLMEMITAMLS